MAVDRSVLDAMRQSVAAAPDNAALRLHLSQLLQQNGEAAECLEQATAILSREPDHVGALELAAWAAEATGDASLAGRYARLRDALSGSGDAGSQSAASGARTSAGPEAEPVERPADVIALDAARGHAGPPASAPMRGGQAASEGPPPEQEGGEVVRLRAIDGGGGDDAQYERPQVTLQDVVGMQHVKERLELAFLGPLKNPEVRRLYGKSLRGGLLLYGPPGCGKTYIARATAGELGAAFFSAGLSDVLDMYLGESERKLHELFESARRHSPCVLFFDELDALGHKRSQLTHGAGRTIVNQLLDELDNVSRDNEGVFVLAATNHPWDVDAALRRPGRFDRTVLVTPPDEAARDGILRQHMNERPQDRIDFRWLAKKTARFSGADLAHLCESATELALADALRSGSARPVGMGDMKKALRSVKASTETWLATARNYAQYANDGGAYDDLLEWLRTKRG